MAADRKSKSQWDFGELFPTEQTRRVLSVTELTAQVKRLLEKQVGQVWVSGEITNFRAQASGHIYFTLKDAGAQLSCVLFRGGTVPSAVRGVLKDGQKVILQGDVTVYEARGQYQLLVHAVELQGVGALQIAFEKLKAKLAAEGLFASERKRAIPRFPRRIGLVTSPTGAAIRDVLHVVQRRNPALEIILVPCRVQGEGAAAELAVAIRLLNEFNVRSSRREEALTSKPQIRESEVEFEQSLLTSAATKLDLILVTRGCGSLEDLWAFNEEIVARAIFESALPVVSAVGHEIDFTISDFVADVRVATPSAAAEIITEDVFASREFVAEAAALMAQRVRQRLETEQDDFLSLVERLSRAHPRRRLNEWLQRLDDLHASLLRATKQRVREGRVACQHLAQRLLQARPTVQIRQQRDLLKQHRRALREAVRLGLRATQNRLATAQARLRLLGPEQVLGRGYSITTDAASGEILRDAGGVKPTQRLKTRLKRGTVVSRAERTE
jgi:exodeoxyribonuclease VII large subunit